MTRVTKQMISKTDKLFVRHPWPFFDLFGMTAGVTKGDRGFSWFVTLFKSVTLDESNNI